MSAERRGNRALRIAGPERLEFATGEIGEPGPDQVLVQVSACGICGSDLRPYRNGLLDLPFFGHEFSGFVRSAGSGIADFDPGDRVASGLARGCGACEACLRGHPNYCEKTRGHYSPGGFAEYCLVTCAGGARPLIKIPDDLDFARATLFEPLSCAMRIEERAEAKEGARVLVIGLGMMGVLTALLIKLRRRDVYVVGADSHRGRVETARSLGLDECIRLGGEGRAGDSVASPEFDLVIDATGAAAVLPLALGYTRLGGRIVLAGVPTEAVILEPLPIFRKELTIVGAKGPYPYPGPKGGSLALELLCSRLLPWERLIRVLPFSEAAAGFELASRGEALKCVLTFPGPDDIS
jgi:threonine dehydrogenase-like Zn-dependent dehydrogenase